MFNKEGIPFFVIMIPFLSIIFIAFFSISFYMKISDERFEKELKEYKVLYLKNNSIEAFHIEKNKKIKEFEEEKEKFIEFVEVLTVTILVFMALFTLLMNSIINETIKKYKKQVETKEKIEPKSCIDPQIIKPTTKSLNIVNKILFPLLKKLRLFSAK